MLAMHVDEPVAVGALVEELWGGTAPSSAKGTVQTYIMQIRKTITAVTAPLAQAAGKSTRQGLVTVADGYLLKTRGEESDVRQFDRLTREAHRARELGDFQTAARKFGDALACWRGRALADVRVGAHLKVEVKRLEEARLSVLNCRIEADLRLGRHHELLGELAGLVERYPSHEGLAAHLMLALYRSGRRTDALASYRRLHATLAAEYGLEPSPQLRRLQRSMLAGDRGPAETADSWHAAVMTRGHSLGRPGRVPRREVQIPAELGALSWQAHSTGPGVA